MENDTFCSEIGSGFRELGGTPPPRITLKVKKKIDCLQSRILSMFCIQNMQKVLKVKTSSVNVKSSFFLSVRYTFSAFVYKASIAEDF